MKRFFATAFVCMLFVSALNGVSPVFAATITPTISTSAPAPQSGTAVSGGVANEPLTVSGGTSIDENTAEDALIPLSLGASMDTEKLTTPNMTFPAKLFSGAVPYLYPLQLKSLLKTPDDNQYFISGKTTLCVQTPDGKSVRVTSPKAYKTAPIPKLAKFIYGSFGLAFLGNQTISLDDTGKYDLAPESQEQGANPECTDTATGDIQKGEETIVTQKFEPLSWFGQFLRSLFSGFSASVQGTVASNTLVPHTKEAEGKTGNIAAGYLPSSMDAGKGKGNGKIANPLVSGASINMNFEETAKIDAESKTIGCSLLSKEKRSAIGLTDEDCAQKTTNTTGTTTCSAGAQPAFAIDATCKLKSTNINGYTLSPKLVETIEAAASAYDVPASLMLAIMFGEGAFNGNKIYSSTAVDPYLDGCSLLPNCSGPEGNIVALDDWAKIGNAVKIVDPAKTPNACNLTDGIFALADSIHRYQYSPAFAGKECFGLDLISSSDKTAKTCAAWNDNNAETAIRYWEIGAAWNDTTRSCATQVGTCSTGGGGTVSGLQCATGKDTCDKINARKSPKSHNGCVWDAYKSH